MPQPTRFVTYDPKQKPKQIADNSDARRIDGHVLCQTCFVSFGTEQALRDHIGTFQLEGQQLMGRMREVSMHLPPHSSQICSGEDDNGDDSGSDSDNDDDDDDDDHDDHHKCPFPGCRRNKSFRKKERLVIHFQKHVQCYETCVFCGNIFNQVRKFLRHKRCKAKGKNSKQAKEYYRKERSAQLRAFAIEQLRRKLNGNKSGLEQTKKREHGEDQCSNSQNPSKKRATNPDSTYQGSQGNSGLQSYGPNGLLLPVVNTGLVSRGNIDMTVRPTQTSFSNQTNHFQPQTNSVNIGLYDTFSPGQGLNMQGRWARVFDEDTITPCYNAESQQPVLPFPSNDPNMVYLAQAQLGAYGEVLPTSTQQIHVDISSDTRSNSY